MLVVIVFVVGVFIYYFAREVSSFDGPRGELVSLLERYDAASCFESEISGVVESDDYIDFRVDVSVVVLERLVESSLIYRYGKNEGKFVSVLSGEPGAGDEAMSFSEMVSAVEFAEKQREEIGLSCEEQKKTHKNSMDLSKRCLDAVAKFMIDGTCWDGQGVRVVLRKLRDDDELEGVSFFVNSDYVNKDFSEEEFLITYSELGVDSADEIKYSPILAGEVCSGVSTKSIEAC